MRASQKWATKWVGVDPNSVKVGLINEGKSPIVEEGISELIDRVVKEGRLSATEDWRKAIDQSDLAMVSVGTPSRQNGSIDLQYLKRVCEQIGRSTQGTGLLFYGRHQKHCSARVARRNSHSCP